MHERIDRLPRLGGGPMLAANTRGHDELSLNGSLRHAGRLFVCTAALLHVMKADAHTGHVA
jgi:hypothetical protein